MLGEIGIDPNPEALIVADLLTAGADREQAAEDLDLGERPLERVRPLFQELDRAAVHERDCRELAEHRRNLRVLVGEVRGLVGEPDDPHGAAFDVEGRKQDVPQRHVARRQVVYPGAVREVVLVDRAPGFIGGRAEPADRHREPRVHRAGQAACLEEEHLVLLQVFAEQRHVTGDGPGHLPAEIEDRARARPEALVREDRPGSLDHGFQLRVGRGVSHDSERVPRGGNLGKLAW